MVFQSNLIFTENYMLLKTTTLNDHIMLDINNQYLIFNFDDGLNMTSVDGTINIGNYHDVYDYSIVNGRLELIYYNKNNLCKTNIEEYHINKLDKIVVSYDNGNVDFEKDLNILEEIDVQSYFSKVEVLCNTEFLKNVFGEYNIELLIKRENHDDVKVSSKVEIKEYVNIIDGGVYCTGHSLKFLGIATLNNIKINSGHNITENGEYTLQLADNLGNIKTYNFLVVDNYYLRNQDNNLFDIIGYVNKELEIAIPLDNIEIIELYVDDKKIEFQYEEDKIIFKLQPVSDFGTKQYTINKIITKDKEYIVNKEFIVNYLKISPTIDIIENNEINPHLSFTVDDPNQTIKYIEFKMSSDNYSNSMYYCFSQDFNFNDSNFIAGTIEIIVCYDLGDGIIRKESISKLNGDYKDLNNLLSVSSIIEGERIKQIELNINMDNISKINNLIVKNQDIACKYNLSQDYTSLLVSIILTSLIVIGFVGSLIIKKCKNKKV